MQPDNMVSRAYGLRMLRPPTWRARGTRRGKIGPVSACPPFTNPIPKSYALWMHPTFLANLGKTGRSAPPLHCRDKLRGTHVAVISLGCAYAVQAPSYCVMGHTNLFALTQRCGNLSHASCGFNPTASGTSQPHPSQRKAGSPIPLQGFILTPQWSCQIFPVTIPL